MNGSRVIGWMLGWVWGGIVIALPAPVSGETLQDMLPGVVRIIAKLPKGGERNGSGFIIQKKPNELAILTAAHVVTGDKYPMVEFFTARGQRVKAEVQEGSELDDRVRGLALLIVREMKHVPQDVKVLSLSREAVQVISGEAMAVLGLPRGAGNWAVIHGHMVARRGRDLMFDARIDEGVSGGPIIRDGQVVGLVQIIETYGQGNPTDSIWVFLQGFGIRPISRGVRGGIVVGGDDPGRFIVQDRKRDQESQQSLPQTKTGKDGAPMVLVSAGEFTMGSPDGEGGSDEHPQHTVDLDAYYIDQYEVTVERYKRFMTQAKRANPGYWDQVKLRRDAKKPVVGIDWNDAQAYCEWAGKRLPTEAEWEKAARGTDKRTYPWGESKPNSSTANFGKAYEPEKAYAEKLKAVGSYKRGKSPFGAYDMAGNVWEWVADWYDKDYYRNSPEKDPQGPSSGKSKVLRGGSWYSNPTRLRSADRGRGSPASRNAFDGVRCAHDAP
jgi:formylglycine-generating enzyme required for sulfatase activity